MTARWCLFVLLLLLPAGPALAGCAPPPGVVTAALPAHPFAAIASADGCSIYVSLIVEGGKAGGAVALLHQDGASLTAQRGVALHGGPAMLVLTADETLLVAADGKDVAFIDTRRLADGSADPVLGYLQTGGMDGVLGIALTPDERTLFASGERSGTVTVIDLRKARAGAFDSGAVLGQVRVGRAPVGLAVSPDGKLLYSTSEAAPAAAQWPQACAHEGGGATAPDHPQGALIVIDVEKARGDPEHATLARMPAGCNPVRVVLSPSGDRAYVSARGSNQVLVFDTAKLVSDKDHALIASVPTGPSPVGLALNSDGSRLIVTNSNRFGPDRRADETLDIVDTARVADGAAAVIGTIPVGAFPRELRVTRDGTLLVTNFLSSTLQLVPLK